MTLSLVSISDAASSLIMTNQSATSEDKMIDKSFLTGTTNAIKVIVIIQKRFCQYEQHSPFELIKSTTVAYVNTSLFF